MSTPLQVEEEKRTKEQEKKEATWVMVVDKKPSPKEGVQSKLSNAKEMPATESWFPLFKSKRSENTNASKTDVKNKYKEIKPCLRNLKRDPSQEKIPIEPTDAQAKKAKSKEDLAPKTPEVLELKDINPVIKESKSTEKTTPKEKTSGRDLVAKEVDENTNDRITELRTRNKFQDWVPLEATLVPQGTTLIPQEDTLFPQEDTLFPQEDTLVKVGSTLVSQEATLVIQESTLVIQEATLVPQEATLDPQEATQAPQDATLVPQEATMVPQEDTMVSQEITMVPQDTTLVPLEATLVPQEAILVAQDAILVPQESTMVPQETTLVPQVATLAPQEATIVPQEATMIPQEATMVPQEAAMVTQEATLVPQEVTLVPQEATLVPQDATLVPQEVTLVPQEVTLVPLEATLVPQEATVVPQEATTVSQDVSQESRTAKKKELTWSDDEYLQKEYLKSMAEASCSLNLQRTASVGPWKSATPFRMASGLTINVPKKSTRNILDLTTGINISISKKSIPASKSGMVICNSTADEKNRGDAAKRHEKRAVKVDIEVPYKKIFSAMRSKLGFVRSKFYSVRMTSS